MSKEKVKVFIQEAVFHISFACPECKEKYYLGYGSSYDKNYHIQNILCSKCNTIIEFDFKEHPNIKLKSKKADKKLIDEIKLVEETKSEIQRLQENIDEIIEDRLGFCNDTKSHYDLFDMLVLNLKRINKTDFKQIKWRIKEVSKDEIECVKTMKDLAQRLNEKIDELISINEEE